MPDSSPTFHPLWESPGYPMSRSLNGSPHYYGLYGRWTMSWPRWKSMYGSSAHQHTAQYLFAIWPTFAQLYQTKVITNNILQHVSTFKSRPQGVHCALCIVPCWCGRVCPPTSAALAYTVTTQTFYYAVQSIFYWSLSFYILTTFTKTRKSVCNFSKAQWAPWGWHFKCWNM